MSNTNTIALSGNLTRDPELSQTQGGATKVKFSIANNRTYKGEKKTMFVPCAAWGKTAELIHQYLRKGSKVIVVGRLDIRDYTDREGAKRTFTEITVNEVEFLTPKGETSNGGGAPREQASEPDQGAFGEGEGGEWNPDEEVPF